MRLGSVLCETTCGSPSIFHKQLAIIIIKKLIFPEETTGFYGSARILMLDLNVNYTVQTLASCIDIIYSVSLYQV